MKTQYMSVTYIFLSRERRRTDCLWIGIVPVKQTFSVNSTMFINELESKFGFFSFQIPRKLSVEKSINRGI